jgi:hypothetical protein
VAEAEGELQLHTGSCHCGAIAIEVAAPERIAAYECDCSMCERTGSLHLIVPAERFSPEAVLANYQFNTGTAQHYFCRTCGCRPYYVPRSNPDGFSVNVRCLNKSTIKSLTVVPYDGKNWERSAGALAHLSKSI